MAALKVALRFSSNMSRVSVFQRRLSTKSTSNLDLRGVFVPLTTPFDCEQNVLYDKLQHNMQCYEQIPFTGYVVAGSNGEAPYLSPTERTALVSAVRQHSSPCKVVIGGATCESTKSTCELSCALAEAGADGVLVMIPFYFKSRMTVSAIVEHFTTVADHSPVPVVIYNMPMVSGIDIAIPTLATLAQHPNIRGVKDGDADKGNMPKDKTAFIQEPPPMDNRLLPVSKYSLSAELSHASHNDSIAQVRKLAGTVLETKGLNFDVLAGSAGYLLPALQVGCAGGINGLAGALGSAVCQLHELCQLGRWDEAIQLQIRLTKPDTLLLAELGVPGLKAAMDMLGLYGGFCRKPILSPTPEQKDKIKECLQKCGFL